MAEKTTVMVLKVDLQCPCCYTKVKKILCKFPQIKDQVYNEKANMVTITVVCCSPEKIRDKICCKGRKVIKSIEIIEPPKPKEKHKETEKTKEVEKTKSQTEKAEEVPKNKPPCKKPVSPPKTPEPTPITPVIKVPELVLVPVGCPPAYPRGYCCGSCYEGHPGGPCYHGYGRPVPPPPPPSYCTCGCGGYGYGLNRGCYVRYDYFSEENQQGCSIM